MLRKPRLLIPIRRDKNSLGFVYPFNWRVVHDDVRSLNALRGLTLATVSSAFVTALGVFACSAAAAVVRSSAVGPRIILPYTVGLINTPFVLDVGTGSKT